MSRRQTMRWSLGVVQATINQTIYMHGLISAYINIDITIMIQSVE